jgi:uncharacterized membrane protein
MSKVKPLSKRSEDAKSKAESATSKGRGEGDQGGESAVVKTGERKYEREPSALSTEYHKARKQLMLWAGILLIWEFVGFDLSKAQTADGNVGAIIRSIKSPQAIPWVLLILVAYFVFKVNVEWYQCGSARRNMRAAKIDFWSAWIVSLAAYALYIAQELSRVQFADLITRSPKAWSLTVGGLLGAVLVVLVSTWRDRRRLGRFDKRDAVASVGLPLLLCLLALLGFQQRLGHSWTFGLIGVGSGALLLGLPVLVLRKLFPSARERTETPSVIS